MALPVEKQAKYWGIALAIFFFVLWQLGDVALPFILGGAIAYFMDPVADRLEDLGLSRTAATATITIVAILVFVIMVLAVVPTLVSQATALFQIAPQLARDLLDFINERFPELLNPDSAFSQTLQSIGEQIQARGGALLQSALSSAAGLVNVLVLLVVVPVVAFYLLLDWDNMVAKVDEMLPRDHAPVIRRLAKEVDTVLAGFVRGMGTVCLILGTYYAVALMLVGLQFGLVVGAIAGLITFIPYVGALVGGALAIGLGLFQFWGDWLSLGAVGVIFIVGQMIEGNYLTPKLVGSSVGLHPVWLLFALSLFGSLFGFVGMLVAVPVAAAIGVLVRYASSQYRDSRLYKGLDGQTGKDAE
ncbi:MAG: AI-2E family transporter [Cognatishimia sp.]|uniref:AI-2E family transporter n=1 Tax=Cognatishimia sp. TaxID=2211648 RepID=UPI00405812BC